MNELEGLVKDYRVAFLRYLPQKDEAALAQGYEIGRAAVARHISVLHLTQVHHLVLSEILADTRSTDLSCVVAAAGEFQREVLAAFDLAQRRRPDAPDAATPTP